MEMRKALYSSQLRQFHKTLGLWLLFFPGVFTALSVCIEMQAFGTIRMRESKMSWRRDSAGV
jgi:hypothetical protein